MKTGVQASLAASLLAMVAALGGAGVRAADAEQVRLCVTGTADKNDPTPEALMARTRKGTAVIVDATEPGACGTLAPSPGPTLTLLPDGQPSPTAIPDPTVPGEYDVCYLVTDSEMEALFHRELTAQPSGTRAGGVHDCLWTFDPDTMEMAAIWLGAYNGWADLAGLSADAIAGVGDEALWVLDGQLWVRIGDTAITVMVISERLDAEETAVAIARLAVPRIR